MSDMIGMDVDAVRRTASELRRKAGEIRAVEARIDMLVRQIGGSWQGDRARRFTADWQSHHRAALRTLADRVDGLGQSALNNAGEQEAASRGGGQGVSRGGAQGPSGGAPWGTVAAGLSAALGLGATFSANKYSTGRYTNTWAKVLKTADGLKINGHRVVPDDFLRFKRSPVFHGLNDHQKLLRGADRFANALGAVDSGADAYFAFKSGDVRNGVADGVNAVTHAVDASPASKHPVAVGVMINARIWTEVGRAATNPEIDWSSEGRSQVMSASPREWATAIKETLPQFGDIVLKKIL